MKQLTLFLSIALLGVQSVFGNSSLQAKADRIHREVLTLDSHNDTPLKFQTPGYDIRHDNKGACVDLPKMEEGGLDGGFFAVYIRQGARDEEGNEVAKQKVLTVFENLHRTIDENPDKLLLATTPDDAYRAKREGKRAVFIGIENGYAIGRDLGMLDHYKALGARYMTLVHGKNNDICDSATDQTSEHNGLSPFGREVVKRMNELGVMVDVSHASEKSALDAIALSQVPVIASHSCAKTICGHRRNMSDSLLVALAAKGGVMQLCILSAYVRPERSNPQYDAAIKALNERYGTTLSSEQQQAKAEEAKSIREKYPQHLATVSDAVDHIDYVVRLVGIDHVGIGTDFDGGGQLADCRTAADLKEITKELIRRGYSDQDIEKIWSGNLMRVMRQAQEYPERDLYTVK